MKKTIISLFLALMLIFSVTLCYAEPEYVVEPKLFRLMFGSFPQWEEITRDDETLYRYAALAIRDVDDALSDSVFDFDNYDEVLVTNLSDTFPMLIVKSSTLKSELWFTPMVDISVDILDTYLNTDFEIEYMTENGHYFDTRILDMPRLRETMLWNPPTAESMKEEGGNEALFRNADSVGSYACGWFTFQYKDQGGFVNTSGEYMTGWNHVMSFNTESGLAVVYRGNMGTSGRSPAYDESSRFGLIDPEGNEVLPCEYNKLDTPTYEGVYRVRKETSGKYQLYDAKARSFIDLSNCDYVSHICDGNMIAAFKGSIDNDGKPVDGQWGFIDRSGTVVIPFQYENVGFLWSEDGYVSVTMNGKEGAIDRTGKLCIPCTWDSLSLGDGGFALGKRDEQYYVIDMQGTIVSIVETKNAYFSTPTTLRVYDDFDDERGGIVDVYGNRIIFGEWRSVEDYGNNQFYVSRKDKNGDTLCGILDNSTGEMLIPMVYNGISSSLKDNRRRFEQLDYYGFMDENFKVVLPVQYEEANSFSEGYATVKMNGQWQIIDVNGTVIY